MTPKERFLTALKGGQPDRVPASPDLSNMIPCKLTGKPFWDIYLHKDPPLYEAYLNALKKYEFEGGWETAAEVEWESRNDPREFRNEVLEKSDEKIVVRNHVRTPDGDLYQDTLYWRDSPPALASKYVKNTEKDFPIFNKYFFPDLQVKDDSKFQDFKKRVGDRGVVTLAGVSAIGTGSLPGLHSLIEIFDGGLEQILDAYSDRRDLIDDYRERQHQYSLAVTQRQLALNPDLLLIGSSGTLIFQTPKIFRELGLSTLKAVTKLAKEAGVPTLMHSCGRERDVVKICAEETDLNGINPLEIPPMGDCNLKELKQKYGKKMCLMGNLHTTDVMLKGTPEQIEQAARQAIEDAAEGGGFILSTGDQCPRDTPEENIYRFIEAAKKYGQYGPSKKSVKAEIGASL